MDITQTLYVTTRAQWRRWLRTHHRTSRDIWLVYYRKDSGRKRIPYDDAVCEALCYGWIDSTMKKIDDQRFAQRFSPRKPTSVLSQMNRERIRELIRQKKMTNAGLAALAHVFDPANDTPDAYTIPPGILRALKANRDAWRHFQKMPKSYQRIRVAYIESRKRHSTGQYQHALAHFVKMTAQNKRIGAVRERRGT